MFDTLRIGCDVPDLKASHLMRHGFKRITSEREDSEGVTTVSVQYQSIREDEHPHYLNWKPDTGALTVETSLPKVVYSDNVHLLKPDDIAPALDELSNRVGDLAGDVPHANEWYVRGRVDACFSWNVDKHLLDYLHAFKDASLPRHYAQAVDRDATLYWRNSSRVIRMYDKEKETGLPHAHGVLRFECQLRHAKKELESLGIVTKPKQMMAKGESPWEAQYRRAQAYRTAHPGTKHEPLVNQDGLLVRDVLNWPVARGLLSHYLGGLGGDLMICPDDALLGELIGRVGARKAVRLFGYIHISRLHSRDEMQRMGFERTGLWRNMRDLRDAGLNVGTSLSGTVLPPLLLPDDYTGEHGQVKG